MGHRATLVRVRLGQTTVFYDHGCGNELDELLFWGPELTERLLIEREANRADLWPDERWAEGGAVVDFDSRRLLWWGGADVLYEPELRSVALACMRANWPGWTVEWAHEGVSDIARAADGPLESVLLQAEPREQRCCLGSDDSRSFELLATVEREDAVGSCRMWVPEGPELGHGRHRSLLGTCALRATDVWSSQPLAGLHVDFTRRWLRWWFAHPVADAQARLSREFPGWTVARLPGEAAEQVHGTKVELPPDRSTQVLRSLFLGGLRQRDLGPDKLARLDRLEAQ